MQAFEGIEDKKKCVTGGDDGRLHLWDIEILANDVLPKVFPWLKEFETQEVVIPKPSIIDAQYFEQTDFFFTSDEARKLKVYKLTGSVVTPLSVY